MDSNSVLNTPFVIHHGECLEVLRTLPDCSIDSVVTDPPYGLSDHKPAEVIACLTAWLAGEPYLPKGKGFMGKTWDAWVPGPEVFRECLRVLKPGGHMLVFAGTRSMDLMSMAIRLAGFELRDSIGYTHDPGDPREAPLMAWCYGSGFPKSMNVANAIHDAAIGQPQGGAKPGSKNHGKFKGGCSDENEAGRGFGAGPGQFMAEAGGKSERDLVEQARQWEGWGTALKPAWEPIILARRPLEGTVAANILAHGTGALNIDGCRVETTENLNGSAYAKEGGRQVSGSLSSSGMNVPGKTVGTDFVQPSGRWPANICHDGSEEVLAAFPETSGGVMKAGTMRAAQDRPGSVCYGTYGGNAAQSDTYGDNGSAARFFYCRADRNEGLEDPGPQFKMGSTLRDSENLNGADARKGNTHPTVKPTDLMRYLCRLITPPGGTVLDPFFGSGSTGKGAILEGFCVVGIERDADSVATAQARCEHAVATVLAAKIEAEDSTRQAVLL